MTDATVLRCPQCGQEIRDASLILTEHSEHDAAFRVWRICSWTCVLALAEINVGPSDEPRPSARQA